MFNDSVLNDHFSAEIYAIKGNYCVARHLSVCL